MRASCLMGIILVLYNRLFAYLCVIRFTLNRTIEFARVISPPKMAHLVAIFMNFELDWIGAKGMESQTIIHLNVTMKCARSSQGTHTRAARVNGNGSKMLCICIHFWCDGVDDDGGVALAKRRAILMTLPVPQLLRRVHTNARARCNML